MEDECGFPQVLVRLDGEVRLVEEAAPRALRTTARPLPVAGVTTSKCFPSLLRNSSGRSAHVVPQS